MANKHKEYPHPAQIINFGRMFIEPGLHRSGWLEVISGGMFSGKTEELIRRLKRSQIAGQPVHIFKPDIDNRYDEVKVVSHDENEMPSTPVSQSKLLPGLAAKAQVIGIDEAQFFDDALPDVCDALANQGKRIIVAGLDMDYLGNPFGPLPHLLAMAEYITKVHAICVKCGALASYSYRLVDNSSTVLLGERNVYEPRCRTCFNAGNAALDA